MPDAVLGMLGTGEWRGDSLRPENWRETILYEFPNGEAPLTAIMSKLPSETSDDPIFHWMTEALGQDSHTVTLFSDSALASAYAGSTPLAVGDLIFVKLTLAQAQEYRIGHVVLLFDDGLSTTDRNAEVIACVKNGASSYIQCRMIDADTSGLLGTSNATGSIGCLIIGNSSEQGSEIPDAIHYKPTAFENYIQTFRNSLDMTRIMLKTRLRSGNKYEEYKRETLRYHSIEMEKAIRFGSRYSTTGPNSQEKYFTGGIRWWLRNYASANMSDYRTDTDFTGMTWEQGGEDYLDKMFEQLKRVQSDSSQDSLILAGSKALKGVSQLAKVSGNVELGKERSTSYGLKIRDYVTDFGTFMMKWDPLFTKEANFRHNMLIVNPRNLRGRYIDDTMYVEDPQRRKKMGRHQRIDGIKEEYLTDFGLELHHPQEFMWLAGIGEDNTL